MSDRKIPAPVSNPEIDAFWEAATKGQLLIKHCDDCDKPHFYPRALCPHCLSANTRWVPSTGQGEVYSYSVNRRVAEPFTIAYVRLDEGVTMLTNLVDCDAEAIRIGQRVSLVFKPSVDGAPLPMFKPA
ncbi:MAG: OB-fold domain-containing protein [Burkholderiaceae bacterium]